MHIEKEDIQDGLGLLTATLILIGIKFLGGVDIPWLIIFLPILFPVGIFLLCITGLSITIGILYLLSSILSRKTMDKLKDILSPDW